MGLLMVVALISYRPEISHCTYAPKPNRQAERQHVLHPFIVVGRIHTIPLFNLLPHTLMECLHHLCFTIIIQPNPFSKGIKSIEVKGLNPYTISNGENSIAECTLRLYANSINGKQSSQFFKFF
jgi:hypothetical protein